jgi:hypothetical protein
VAASRVRRVALVVGFIAAWWALMYWATPEECRDTRPQEWSQMCQRMMLN